MQAQSISSLAYLKTPDKVRAALINTVGSAPPLTVIERELKKCAPPTPLNIGEPTDDDGLDYAPHSKSHRGRLTGLASERLAAIRAKLKADEWERKAKERRLKLKLAKERREFDKRYSKLLRALRGNATKFAGNLIEQVCGELEVDPREFESDSRRQEIVRARAVVAKLLRERDAKVYSLSKIATCINRKDHSTVHNLIKNFEAYCQQDPRVGELYKALGGSDGD